MNKQDKRIDDYIEKSSDFAKPILNHLRELVHKACPEVKETMKWSFPNFDYKGAFCHMAAFKEHCSFTFLKASLMKNADTFKAKQNESMGHLGKIKYLSDLPSDKILFSYLKEAIKLNDEGIKLPPKKKNSEPGELIIPQYLSNALSENHDANKIFEAFSPSHKKQYVQWLTEAKTEATRNKRIAKAIEQIAAKK